MVDNQNAQEEDQEMDQVGFAKVDITPDFPVNLYKHCKKPENITEVLDPIYAKCLTLSNLAIISTDLLYISNDLYSWVSNQTPKELILNASHAHATPDLKDIRYTVFLKEKLKKVLVESSVQSPGKVYYGEGQCNLNINRRKKIHRFDNVRRWKFKKTVELRPNPDGIADKTIKVIKVIRDSKAPIYVINYPCHATMWHGRSISADWPGRIKLDGEVMFLQGFSGNLIPNNIKQHKTWKDRIIELVERTPDFKKADCTEQDMIDAANLVARSVKNVEYKKI